MKIIKSLFRLIYIALNVLGADFVGILLAMGLYHETKDLHQSLYYFSMTLLLTAPLIGDADNSFESEMTQIIVVLLYPVLCCLIMFIPILNTLTALLGIVSFILTVKYCFLEYRESE